ncbi:response regulator transcription factor [Alkalibacillus aidingensis]|uniref:response regulator transcription factor n=1 Tax=Alkalibacillus aidingensis TaxID=2747607 RepID=UPI001661198D|nr:response regulator transcription factor [Alkalibacillus aidingensis]
MATKVLIVDDEESITTLIDYHLQQTGYRTQVVHDGEEALDQLNNQHFDLAVLDLMLPNKSGLEICEMIRNQGNNIPIIMLTAKGEEEDKIKGLNVGADDYVTKPFSPKELIARVDAVLRRIPRSDNESDLIKFRGIEINTQYYEVFKNGKSIEFTRKEFELLVYMAKQINKPIKRDTILKDIWDFEYVGDTRIVDVHISHLREKLEDDPKKPTLIKTVRGVGYKIEG